MGILLQEQKLRKRVLFYSFEFLLFFSLLVRAEGAGPHLYLSMQWPHGACIREKCVKNLPDRFTIHGLWVFDTSTGWPNIHKCTPSSKEINEFDEDLILNLLGELEIHWPSLTGPSVDLWRKQWEIFGTCTNFTQYEYFDKTLRLAKIYNLTEAFTASRLDPTRDYAFHAHALRDAIEETNGRTAEIDCITRTRPRYLKEVRLCFNQQLELINCPHIWDCIYDDLSLRFSLRGRAIGELTRERHIKKRTSICITLVGGLGFLGWWFFSLWKKCHQMRRLSRTE